MYRPQWLATAAACLLVFLGNGVARAEASPAAILQQLRSFSKLATVLMVAAHPDDENTQLITYLSLGRGYRMGYLSVTRGDGGQNVLGPEFGAELGAIRTQELLAARRIDGGRQFFTRAIDFGFSKDYEKTLTIWDHQQVLADIVRTIRKFRPDVMVTRFSTIPGNTHGHHTASAVLALEAFKLAGDPNSFPGQLTGGITVWQPKRIFYNGFGAGMIPSSQLVAGAANTKSSLRIDISGNDSVSGDSFGTIAARSRSQHRTQGFGDFGAGGGGGRASRSESFQLLDGKPASKDIMDGIDTTWARVKGGDAIVPLIDQAIAKFDEKDPAASVPALLEICKVLAKLPADPVVDDRRRQFDRILADCLGLSVQTHVVDPEAVPGETLNLIHHVTLASNLPVRWIGVRYPSVFKQADFVVDLKPGEGASKELSQMLPPDTPLSQPYWLAAQGTPGMFRVTDPSLIGLPENPPAFPVEQLFEVDGQTLVIPDEPVAIDGKHRGLEVVPPVWLKVLSDVQLFAPGETRTVQIEASESKSPGVVQLDAPTDWKVSPANQPLNGGGRPTTCKFSVTAPAQLTSANLVARVTVGGRSFENQRVEIHYDHIPELLLQPQARITAVSLDLITRGKNIGYIDGAGDGVADAIRQMGYTVAPLTGADLTPDRLKDLDAVVIGVRALNVRKDLAPHMQALFDYASNGGTVIEQYNRPNGLQTDQLAPYSVHLSSDRVTDETAPMKFLAPDHPALNVPNKITAADFDGWVQERGIYFPNQWDDHFTPILACNDPGERQLNGALLVAHPGKGYFVCTSLVFFRQLPAGNPGAYRLFANLLSLGK